MCDMMLSQGVIRLRQEIGDAAPDVFETMTRVSESFSRPEIEEGSTRAT